MTGGIPDFDDLVGGDDLAEEDRERLVRVHRLLVAAGPPAELPETLRAVAPPKPSIIPFPRKYRFTAFAAALLLAVVLLGAGYAIGRAGQTDTEAFTVPMTGPRGAIAELVVFEEDGAGNWPMRLDVTGLPILEQGELYELWLTKNGKPVAPCGSFIVEAGKTTVPLNAPYRLRQFTGWIVVRAGHAYDVLLRTSTV